MEVYFDLRLNDRAADHAVIIIPVLTRPGNCGICGPGQVIIEQYVLQNESVKWVKTWLKTPT